MPKPLDPKSRNILEFRPNISFVEPEVRAGEINPIVPDQPQLENVYEDIDELKKLSKSVNVLATAVQSRVDEVAKDLRMAITDDDDAARQAMARLFPGQSSNEITYDQYKKCKDTILQEGINIGDQMILTDDDVGQFKDCATKAIDNESCTIIKRMGKFGTPESADGRLRPELEKRGQVIKPLNYKETQADLLCVLANMLWQTFMMPVFEAAEIPVAEVSIASLLPSKLCYNDGGIDFPGIDDIIKQGITAFAGAKKKVEEETG